MMPADAELLDEELLGDAPHQGRSDDDDKSATRAGGTVANRAVIDGIGVPPSAWYGRTRHCCGPSCHRRD